MEEQVMFAVLQRAAGAMLLIGASCIPTTVQYLANNGFLGVDYQPDVILYTAIAILYAWLGVWVICTSY